jgi:hypothetical protein
LDNPTRNEKLAEPEEFREILQGNRSRNAN